MPVLSGLSGHVCKYIHTQVTCVLVIFLHDRVLGRNQCKREFLLSDGWGDEVHCGRQSMGMESVVCPVVTLRCVKKQRTLQQGVELAYSSQALPPSNPHTGTSLN